MFLTVIVPVYNVEDYIKRCILSIINNDLDIANYEIIVVDDESPDNSKEIVKELAIIYPQIQLISQKNKGLGGARNTGILNAKGKYVLFLDSDDLLVEGVLGRLEQIIRLQEEPDILEYSFSNVTQDQNVVLKYTAKELMDNIPGIEYYNNALNFVPSACNKLYRSSFLRDNKLLFKERIYSEDFEFNTRAFFYAKTVNATDLEVSHFIQTTNSITRNDNFSTQLKLVNDLFIILKFILSFEKNVSSYSDLENIFFKERLSLLNVNIIFQAIKYKFSYNKIKELKKQLIDEELYFIDYPIRDRKKNFFRIIIKNQFYFLRLYLLLNSVLKKK